MLGVGCGEWGRLGSGRAKILVFLNKNSIFKRFSALKSLFL
jgi:hypothetical protein